MPVKQTAGPQGEAMAARFLQQQGYEILERNYRYRRAEVDIIARKGRLLVFVEVKARSSDAFGYPEDFVDEKQAARITGAADHYIEDTQWEGLIRFDIISILLEQEPKIEHFEDAFY